MLSKNQVVDKKWKLDETVNTVLESPVAFYAVVDANACFTFISNVVFAVSGFSAEELTGRKAELIIHHSDKIIFAETIRNLKAGQTSILPSVRLHDKENEAKKAAITLTNFLSTEPFNGILINFQVISNSIQVDEIEKQVISSHAAFFTKHPFGIFHMSLNGVIDRINPQLMQDLGYSLSEIQNCRLLEFLLPIYRRKAFLMFYEAVKNAEPETYDVQVYTVKGVPIHVNFTIVPVVYQNRTIEIYGIVKDISERLELNQSLRRTSVVADNSLSGVIIMNSKRETEWVNKGFTLMNGFTLEEVIGKDPAYLLDVEVNLQQKLLDMQEALVKGKSVKQDVLCKKKDGSTFWNFVEVTPVLNKNGFLDKIVSIHTDITEKKKAEDDLKRLADDLYRQNKELHQFAYIVSHNLRSPVASIVGLANVLDMYIDDPETLNDGIKDLIKAAGNLDTVIKDLSTILEITNSSSRGLVKETINLNELLEQIQIALKVVIVNSSAKIVVLDESCILYTNKAYLYSIFYNLISNAIKYKSNRIPEIKISYECDSEKTTFKVEDNGRGIDLNKNAEHLFKPYKRFNFDVEGKGLGLFLVKSHIEAFGGTIEVKSEVGEGTAFIFTIPANPVSA